MLEKLNKETLLDLIYDYDRYIIEFYEEHDTGMTPVCVEEYYNNEYQEKFE